MKRLLLTALLTLACAVPAYAADYVIDTTNAHASINFRIKHLGYSWLIGRFDDFDGKFSYDEKNPDAAKVEVNIRPASINSNHAERDKHLRSKEFLYVDQYPTAKFVSTSFHETGNGKAVLKGDLTLRGVTKPITIDVDEIGAGPDPWGGYRRGFYGTTDLVLKEFGIEYDLGPAARTVELELAIEGVRQ